MKNKLLINSHCETILDTSKIKLLRGYNTNYDTILSLLIYDSNYLNIICDYDLVRYYFESKLNYFKLLEHSNIYFINIDNFLKYTKVSYKELSLDIIPKEIIDQKLDKPKFLKDNDISRFNKSLLIKYTDDIRQKYYLGKQSIKNYIDLYKKFLEFKEVDKIDEYEEHIRLANEELSYLKQELDSLPHIPNKQERKQIRQNKAKNK